ncbi:16S rRNA (cytosine(1402)-N(4))-methyltransferase [Micractinium conductrix]|uniref:16S rRNA (Cytosine(1402)-N(4))-methyltransferase n=1 Tax=Micractinium conductrix TaxID=554055 RepID=A0A2P6VNL6_9CHLO|nr:16S rRNA (cytosine(1402)-N(4))-methyltransferase [Micractinium conductrix]|eukprot:PSC75684.1 16S rRNA (cytosine(1402)-N(4))-methyltransferase [Micractinium conductrix]
MAWRAAATSTGVRALLARAAAAVAPEAAPAAGAAAEQPHVSVLLDEVLKAFEGLQVRCYVDGTLGAGGHASAVLRAHPEMSALVGFDLDPTAHALASARLAAAGAALAPVAVTPAGVASLGAALPATVSAVQQQQQQQPTAFLVRSNFGRMKQVLRQLPLDGASGSGSSSSDGSGGGSASGSEGVDAILLDLGISSMQVDTADRGFSFLRDGPLDMRMDPGAVLSAELAVNSWSEAEIGRVIKEYGEERHWRGIACRIVAAREEAPITTTQQLVAAIGNPGGGGRGGGRGGRGRGDAKFKHPATRTFQALRIAVNGELQSIAQVIPDAIDCLAPGGRLAVITFHSLEDRIVKWAFRAAAGMAPSDEPLPSYCLPFDAPEEQPLVKILTRRPTVPGDAEQAANVRSRSAKLRVVQKL